jgi:hypothetical protein
LPILGFYRLPAWPTRCPGLHAPWVVYGLYRQDGCGGCRIAYTSDCVDVAFFHWLWLVLVFSLWWPGNMVLVVWMIGLEYGIQFWTWYKVVFLKPWTLLDSWDVTLLRIPRIPKCHGFRETTLDHIAKCQMAINKNHIAKLKTKTYIGNAKNWVTNAHNIRQPTTWVTLFNNGFNSDPQSFFIIQY